MASVAQDAWSQTVSNKNILSHTIHRHSPWAVGVVINIFRRARLAGSPAARQAESHSVIESKNCNALSVDSYSCYILVIYAYAVLHRGTTCPSLLACTIHDLRIKNNGFYRT